MFHHFEYIGEDFEADMAAIEADPVVLRWWSYCEPCQQPLHWEGKPPSQGGDGGEGGAWWAEMKCLNHCGGWSVAWSQSWPDPDFSPNNLGARSRTSTRTTCLPSTTPRPSSPKAPVLLCGAYAWALCTCDLHRYPNASWARGLPLSANFRRLLTHAPRAHRHGAGCLYVPVTRK